MTSEYCSFPWDRSVWNLRESVCIASIEQKHQKNIHCNWNDPKRMRHRRILWFMVILYVSIKMQIYNILRDNNNTNKNKTRIHKVSTRLFVGSMAHNYSPVINSSETFFYLKNSGDQIRPIGKRSNCVECENVHSDSVKNRHWMCPLVHSTSIQNQLNVRPLSTPATHLTLWLRRRERGKLAAYTIGTICL